MNAIKLNPNITNDQYQMVIRVLEAMGVLDSTEPKTEEKLPYYHEELENIREKHLKGISKSYSWNEVKSEILSSKK